MGIEINAGVTNDPEQSSEEIKINAYSSSKLCHCHVHDGLERNHLIKINL